MRQLRPDDERRDADLPPASILTRIRGFERVFRAWTGPAIKANAGCP